MSRVLLPLCLFFFTLTAVAQNPSTVFAIAQKTISMPCGSNCTAISAVVPHIRQSNDYLVQSIPYWPFAYAAGGTELASLYADDIYSSAINLPFTACFYGANYNRLVVGSNGLLTFDITNAGRRNNFRQTVSFSNPTPVPIPYAGGTQNSLASTYYPKAAVMGVYHDVFPFDNGARRIEWRIEGTAPKRRFIASFKDVPLYSCTSLTATHQMVIYESTGVVEVYVQDKPVCPAWNEGLAILGIQNFDRNKAAFPAGKNASRWGAAGMNEAYRFTPTAGTPLFKRAELLLNGSVVALADTASGSGGQLQLNFPTICPSADSTQYIMRVVYGSCTNPGEEVSFEDTVSVIKEKLHTSLQTQNPTCTTGGTITAQSSGVSTPVVYRLNGGPAQTTPIFSNLPPGNYTVTASTGVNCSQTRTASLVLEDDLHLTTLTDTTVCQGAGFSPRTLSNGTSFSWSPTTGVSNPSIANPVITSPATMRYTLTATKGICQRSATVNVIVKPLPQVNAGPDQTIVQGDIITLNATASAGTYLWTPSAGLSATTILNPTARPGTTTTYTLAVTANGCTASDDVTITVAPYCIKPMEAFTPNGDGINDLWLVTNGNCLQQAKVDVFNRYGARVYQSHDYKNNWNGTYEGRPLPDGTYYFIITYQLVNGKTVQQKGNVTILR